MASRYWVGGTAAWDGTAGTKWALTSGGAGGQTVPTSADDVFFTNLSTGNCSISAGNTGAKSITCTGFTGTLSGAGISVAGSITLVAGMTFSASPVTITGTGTIISAGKSFGQFTVNGSAITVTLGDAMNLNSQFTLTQGTFTTSNFTFTTNGNMILNGTLTTVINLGSSTINTNVGWIVSPATLLTVNAGTSTINITGGGSFYGGGKTYYNVAFTSTSGLDISIDENNTFNNLTLTAPAATGIQSVFLIGTITTTTMICAGGSAIRRIFLQSNTVGTARTITATTWTTVTDVDFRDITLTNAKSGTRLGNAGGNTNITFNAVKTVYWNLAGAQNWSATGWATSSGGVPAVNNFPLAQDTATFDNAGAADTISNDDSWNVGTVNMSTRTTAMTLSFPLNLMSVYGNWSNGTGTTISGSAVIQFAGRTAQTITSNGKTFPNEIGGIGASNTITLADALTCSALFSLTGTTGFNLGNNTLTASSFTNQTTSARTLAFGTGNVTVTGVNSFNIFSTSLTVTGTPVVNVTYSGASAMTVTTGTLNEANSISFNFTAGTYSLAFLESSNTAKNINFTGFAGTWATYTTPIIYGNLTVSTGMTITGSASTVSFRATSGTKTITSNGITFDFPITFNGIGGTWQLQDNLTQGSTRLLTLTNGTLDLNGRTHSASNFTSATGTKNLTFNGGTLTLSAVTTTAFNNAAPTNFTTTAGTGTGTITMTGATAKTFVGGGSTFNCTLNQGGAGALTITGANTFSDISNTYSATAATTITLAANQTVSNFTATGTVGKVLTLNSSVAGTARTLTKTSGTVAVNYLSIQDSTATGGAAWYAGANSTNVSNNTGWIFANAPTASGNFLMLFM